ncbi:DUF1592 domain-containing protein [Rosistilla carotiformis]|nr:DUF1592 domain-containing protein [Rosistilla carotiformis]
MMGFRSRQNQSPRQWRVVQAMGRGEKRSIRGWTLAVLMTLTGGSVAWGQPVATFTPDQVGFDRLIEPFLKQHCLRCHGPEEALGEFRIDRDLGIDLMQQASHAKWGEVVNVLNSHEMPPQDEPQPDVTSVGKVVDWITDQMVRVEQIRRDASIIIRRMNRDEYRNTIRDLVGIDYDTSHFPQDPPTGGFDNNGGALTVSPLHLELYYNAAREILDRAIVDGDQPAAISWRFEPESGDSDRNRVEYDKQRLIVNGGKNRVVDRFVVMHHASCDRKVNVRSFQLKQPGPYRITIRAAGVVPTREQVVASAEQFLRKRMADNIQKHPDRSDRHREQFERDLAHFSSDSRYDYGPPRVRVIQHLAGQPAVLAEFDIDASPDSPKEYPIDAIFSTESAGITIEYAYDIPKEVENFWMQTGDDFARPEAWIDSILLEGPIYPQWPPESHVRLLPEATLKESDPTSYVRTVVARFMQRAYRRRVTSSELDAKMALFDGAFRETSDVQTAIRAPLIAILMSSHFLYLAEPEGADGSVDAAAMPRALNDFELATRLSYFLWSSMPDEALFHAAAQGRLRDPETRLLHVERMLEDPKSEALVKNFAGQWLGLREVGANPPAAELYRRYDRHLETSIVGESLSFFRELLLHDLDVMNFIASDFVVINQRLARFYGIPGVHGDHFRRVAVPAGVHRGGVLTQASVLSITSNGTRTSPVKRGTWVLKNLLGSDPGLPVANAGEIAPKVPGIDKATVRQRLEIHRELPQCARCHDKIDPLGFALENYDASGFWRLQEGHGYQGRIGRNDPVIDASSRLPDGTPVDGIDGLQQALLQNEDAFLRCLAEKMLTYALGRELGIADRVHLDAAVNDLQANGKTLRQLIRWIVVSEPFQTK